MSERIGFLLDVDIKDGINRVRQFGEAAASAVRSASAGFESLSIGAQPSRRDSSQASAQPAQRPGREARERADFEAFSRALGKAAQAANGLSAIDFDAFDDSLRESAKAVQKNIKDYLRGRAARFPEQDIGALRQYLNSGANPLDPDNAKLFSQFSGAELAAEREFYLRSVLHKTGYQSGGSGGSGGGNDTNIISPSFGGGGTMRGLAGKALGLLGVGAGIAAISGALSNASEAGQRSTQVSDLLRSLRDTAPDFDTFREQLWDSTEGLRLTHAETLTLARQFGDLARASDGVEVALGVQAAAGLARGFGFEPGAAVGAFGRAEFAGIGAKPFSLLIADAVAASGAWSKADEITDAIGGWIEQSTRTTIDTPNAAGYTDVLTRLTQLQKPGVYAGMGAQLLSSIDATVRGGGGRGEASQIFLLDAMSRYGGVKGALQGEYFLQQGMFAELPNGNTVFNAAIESLNARLGEGPSLYKSANAAGVFGTTTKQAEALLAAMNEMGSSASGFALFLQSVTGGSLNIRPDAVPTLADLFHAPDARVFADTKAEKMTAEQRAEFLSETEGKTGEDLRQAIGVFFANAGREQDLGSVLGNKIADVQRATETLGQSLEGLLGLQLDVQQGLLAGVNNIVDMMTPANQRNIPGSDLPGHGPLTGREALEALILQPDANGLTPRELALRAMGVENDESLSLSKRFDAWKLTSDLARTAGVGENEPIDRDNQALVEALIERLEGSVRAGFLRMDRVMEMLERLLGAANPISPTAFNSTWPGGGGMMYAGGLGGGFPPASGGGFFRTSGGDSPWRTGASAGSPLTAPGGLASHFAAIEQQYGLPAGLLTAIASVESNFNPRAVSRAGAQGMFQLMPDTSRSFGVDPWNPYDAAHGAAKHLLRDYRQFGDWNLAVAAYNAGPGAVSKHGGVPPFRETQDYMGKIERAMQRVQVEVTVVHRRPDGSVIRTEQPPTSVATPTAWGGARAPI